MDARAPGPGLGRDPAANARKRRHTDSFDAAPQHLSQRPHKMPRAVSQSFSMPQPEYYQPQPHAYSEPLHQFPVFFPTTQPLSAAEAYHPLAFDPSPTTHETLWSPPFQSAVPMPVTSNLMHSPLAPAVTSARYGPPADAQSVELNTPYQFHPATFPTPDLTESEADDFNQHSNRLSRSVSVAQEPKQHYDSLAMGYMTASSSATPGHRETGTPSSLPAPPTAYQQSLSPPHIEPRPSLPPSAASIDTTPHVYSPSPSRTVDSQSAAAAAATLPKGMKCHHCHEPCKGPKALKRHVWEQHEMNWCHFCPFCSYLVSFEPRQGADESGHGGSDSLKVLRCSHCDDDEACLAPQDVVPHFRKYHYHSLSSTRMLFIKRPDDVSRHFDAKKKRKDDGHRWLHEHVEVAKDVFKVEDGNSNTVRGCDRGCDDCGGTQDGLAGFVKHCSDTRKDGLPQAQKDDTAFTLQVRNILSSGHLQSAWAACLKRRGEPAKIKWKYNGEAPSKLLADLETAATCGLGPRDKLIERAYDMMHGKGNGSR